MKQFSFEGDIAIVCWRTSRCLSTVDAEHGFVMMGRSSRYSTEHCTAAVRELHQDDAADLGIERTAPVLFIPGNRVIKGTVV